MQASFRFSTLVSSWLLVLSVLAIAIALFVPTLSIWLAMAGAFATAVIWFKVAFRTQKWLWWEFGTELLTPAEGMVGISGVVLFAAGFIAVLLLPMVRNAT